MSRCSVTLSVTSASEPCSPTRAHTFELPHNLNVVCKVWESIKQVQLRECAATPGTRVQPVDSSVSCRVRSPMNSNVAVVQCSWLYHIRAKSFLYHRALLSVDRFRMMLSNSKTNCTGEPDICTLTRLLQIPFSASMTHVPYTYIR